MYILVIKVIVIIIIETIENPLINNNGNNV